METFDPYQQWFGIPSKLRPLNHYILLGVGLFESDPAAILGAYDARMTSLKLKEQGEHGELSQKLMAEIGKAKLELSDPKRKAIYDEKLQASFQASETEPEPVAADLPKKFKSSVTTIDESVADQSKGGASAQAQRQQVAPGPVADSMDSVDSVDEELSVWGLLLDFRIWVALVATTFVIALATIKLLSGGASDEGPTTQNSATKVDEGVSKKEFAANENDHQAKVVGATQANNASNSKLKKVQQRAGGKFELPIRNATLEGGLKHGAEGIVGWESGDQAVWLLVLTERRTGFFHCKVTYRATSEAPFDVQLGDRKPLPLTFYSHKEDFEEEFIVKIDKGNEQPFRLIAGELEFSPGVVIKRITLTPTK